MEESKLHLSNRIIKLYQDPQSCSKQDIISMVYLSNSLTLPLYSDQVIMNRYKGPSQKGSYIVEPKSGEQLPFSIARTLVEPRNSEVPVRLLNPKPELVTLRIQIMLLLPWSR